MKLFRKRSGQWEYVSHKAELQPNTTNHEDIIKYFVKSNFIEIGDPVIIINDEHNKIFEYKVNEPIPVEECSIEIVAPPAW